MKNLTVYIALTIAAVCVVFVLVSITSNAQVFNPSVSNPAVANANDAMLKRIQDLEKKVDQLQKEMAGAKLVAAGMDKTLANMKAAHESHTHRLNVDLSAPTTVDTAERTGGGPLLLVTYSKQVLAMPPGKRGAFTTAPIKD